jgi:hypothetical protein
MCAPHSLRIIDSRAPCPVREKPFFCDLFRETLRSNDCTCFLAKSDKRSGDVGPSIGNNAHSRFVIRVRLIPIGQDVSCFAPKNFPYGQNRLRLGIKK